MHSFISIIFELAKAFLNMFMYLFKTKIQPPRPETEKLSNSLPPELQHIMKCKTTNIIILLFLFKIEIKLIKYFIYWYQF